MTYFADAQDLQTELKAFLEDFVRSPAAERACRVARDDGLGRVLALRTNNPSTAVRLDIVGRRVMTAAEKDTAGVDLELEADDLHDLLLNRLGPVEISQLYETDGVQFAGRPEALAAVAVLAGELQPFYPAGLTKRGRADLLQTPERHTRVFWEVSGPPKEVIGRRRPWQRPKKTAHPV
jgi:hypothetical protein